VVEPEVAQITILVARPVTAAMFALGALAK
jgi:hypothetical protein